METITKRIFYWYSHEYLSEAELFGDQSSLHGRRSYVRDTFQIRSTGDISKEGECASIASFSNSCRRPKPAPDLNRGKDSNCLELSLKLYHVWELRSRCQQSTAEAPSGSLPLIFHRLLPRNDLSAVFRKFLTSNDVLFAMTTAAISCLG